MAVRTLTIDEYIELAKKAIGREDGAAAAECRQVHRLLCEGREPDDLTPLEQIYAVVFKGATLSQIANDYGWEPGVDVPETKPAQPKGPKSRKEEE